MSSWKPMVEELAKERSPRLLGYGVMLTGSVAEAEDLLHDAIVKAFGRGRRFKHLNAAEAYVRRTMQTLAVDRHRSRRALQRALERNDSPPTPPPDIEFSLDIEVALGLLSTRERVCVLMRFYDDMTTAAIAESLGLADGTVKRYLSNALKKLAVVIPLDAASLEVPEKLTVTHEGGEA